MNISFEASDPQMKVEDTQFNDVFRRVHNYRIYVRTYDGAIPIFKNDIEGVWMLGKKIYFNRVNTMEPNFHPNERVTVLGKLSIEMD